VVVLNQLYCIAVMSVHASPRIGTRHWFVVRDRDGKQLAYIQFEERRSAAKMLTKDEARRIAANIAKLPEVVRKP
jgi:hypothetical protein